MTRTIAQEEAKDVRSEIFNSLMDCPHGDVNTLINLHKEMGESDPEFYAKLAIWNQDSNSVRDQIEVYIASLLISPIPEARVSGVYYLLDLPPYQVNRVIDHIKGKKDVVHISENADSKQVPKTSKKNGIEVSKRSKASEKTVTFTKKGKRGASDKKETETIKTYTYDVFEKRMGKSSLPKILRTAIKNYLKIREQDQNAIDGIALSRNRESLKTLYTRMRIKPNDYVRAIIFSAKGKKFDTLRKKSRYMQVKELAKCKDDANKQAEIIVKNKIPYTTAVGALKTITPPVLIALINSMSDKELLNNIGSIKKHGAFRNDDIKEMIEGRIGKMTKSKNVDALKAKQVTANVSITKEVQEKLTEVTDKQIQAKANITRPTALLIDASASMNRAIQLGKEIGSVVAPQCQNGCYTYVFSDMAKKVDCQSDKLSDWDHAMKWIKASGCTCNGAALEVMRMKNEVVEQILMITDEGENRAPSFAKALESYKRDVSPEVEVIIVRMDGGSGKSDKITKDLQRKDHSVNVIDIGKADYYSIPNILNLLSGKSRFELVMDIMDLKFVSREQLDEKIEKQLAGK